MPKDRTPIPDELAARVIFASDATCCVCRTERHKVQIHHVDEDPSNHTFDNLAVLCMHCHSDAHTNGAFVRRLTPDVIRLYNSSWRSTVKLKLIPTPDTPGRLELLSEAFLEAGLACHDWRTWFVTLANCKVPDGEPGEFSDIWDLMAKRWIPVFTEDTYRRYVPLFERCTREIERRYDRLVQLFIDVLPAEFRTLLGRAVRRLEFEREAYAHLSTLSRMGVFSAEAAQVYFSERFVGVINVLRDVTREADKGRKEAESSGA